MSFPRWPFCLSARNFQTAKITHASSEFKTQKCNNSIYRVLEFFLVMMENWEYEGISSDGQNEMEIDDKKHEKRLK